MTNESGKDLLHSHRKNSLVSWAIFASALIVVLISLTTVVFPSLMLRSFGGVVEYVGIDSFETGIWAPTLLVADVIIFGLVILAFKNKLPQVITKLIKQLFNFEISARIAFVTVLIILGTYVAITMTELPTEETWPDYHNRVKPLLENWSVTKYEGIDQYVTLFFLYTSLNVFGNGKLIPFVASAAMLLVTYLLTTEITKKRFAGILSMAIMLQSGTFFIFDTTATYPNFWVLFYLLSLYLCYKKWPASPISFILSVLSKQNAALFLPMTLFFTYESGMPRRKKIGIVSVHIAIVILGIAVILIGTEISFWGFTATSSGFQPHDFWRAFNAFSYQLRFDGLILVLLLPLTVGLGIASRKKILHSDSVLFLIIGAILSQPLMAAFTIISSEPYRFMPLVAFCAIGIGVMFSKNKIN